MPIFTVKDKRGNELKIHQDHPPTKEELDYSFNQYYPEEEQKPQDDGIPFYLKPAEVPPSLSLTPQHRDASSMYGGIMAEAPPTPEFMTQAESEGGRFGEPQRAPLPSTMERGEDIGYGYYKPQIVDHSDPRAGQEIKRQGAFGRFIEETAQAPVRIGMVRKNEKGEYVPEYGRTEVTTGDEIDPRYNTAISVPLPTDFLINKYGPDGKLKDAAVGLRNAAAGLLNFFASPQGAAMGAIGGAGKVGAMSLNDAFKMARAGGDVMPLLQALREPANRGVAGAFAVDMAKHAPEALQAGDDAMKQGDIGAAIEHWAGGVSQLVLSGMSAKHGANIKTYKSPDRMLAKTSSQMSLDDAQVPFKIKAMEDGIAALEANPKLSSDPKLQADLKALTEARDTLAEWNDERIDRQSRESTEPLSEEEVTQNRDLKERLGAGEKLTAEQVDQVLSFERRNRLNADPNRVNDIIGDIDTMLDDAIKSANVGDNVVKLDESNIPPGSAASGSIAYFDQKTGKIVINTRALAADIADMPTGSQREYIRSMVNEEAVHSFTTTKEALTFLKNASPAEIALARSIYGKQGKGLNDVQLGMEMIRRRFQQLNRIDPTEVSLMVGPEGWGVETMEVMDRVLKSARRVFDRTSSKEQRKVLDSIQEKFDLAKRMAERGQRLEPMTHPGEGAVMTPRRTTRADVENLGHEDFWKESMAWAKESMSSPEGISPQVRAEMAALTDKDIEGWKAAAAKAEAEAKAIRDEVMANPQSLGDVKVQQKFGGAAQKAQFFNEGLAMLTGDKKPDAKTLRLLAEGEQIGTPRKGQRSKEEMAIDLSEPPQDPIKWAGWLRSNFDKARRIPDEQAALDVGKQLLREIDDKVKSERDALPDDWKITEEDFRAELKEEGWKEEDIDSAWEEHQANLGMPESRTVEADNIDLMDAESKSMLEPQYIERAYLERDIYNWMQSRKSKPDTGEPYQGEMFGSPRKAPKYGDYKGPQNKEDLEARRIFKTTDHDAIINKQGKEYAIKSPDQMIMIDDSGAPIMSPRKGMSKKAEKHIEELKKYREQMGQKPVEPQGPAPGSVSKRSAPASSRKPASAFFPPPTPESVEKSANYVLDSLVRERPKLKYDMQGNVSEVGVERTFTPSFQRFVDDVRSKHGNVDRDQLWEQWDDAVRKRLESATEDQMIKMVNDLGLRREVFGAMKSGGGKDVFVQEKTGQIAGPDVEPAQTTAKQKAIDRSERLLREAEKMELQAKASKNPRQAAELSQRAQIMRRTSENLSQAARTGEGLPAQQTSLFPGILSPKATVTGGKTVPVKGEAGGEKIGQKMKTTYGRTKQDKAELAAEYQAHGPQVKARERAKSAIYRKLMEDKPSLKAGLNRREIGEEDIRWEETGADILRVTPDDLTNLEKLGMELTRGAATDASTKRLAGGGAYTIKEEALPRSATKRVVALEDRKTGEVHLVSAYRDGDRGPVFRDPGSVTGEHRTLEQLISRYRPMFSIPLRTPVQKFLQTFKSAADMHAKFSHRIDVAGRRIGWRGMGTTPPIEGTPGLEGEGGTFQGPEKDIVSEWYDMTEGSREKGNELTPQEARNIYDVFEPMETSTDAVRMISKLRERAEGSRLNQAAKSKIDRLEADIDKLRELRSNVPFGKDAELTEKIDAKRKEIADLEKDLKPELTHKDWALITAMTKVNRQLQIQRAKDILAEHRAAKKAGKPYEPKPTSSGMYEETLNTLYDLVQRFQTKQGTVRSLEAQFAKRHGPAAQAGRETPLESQTAREVTMRRRRPPTDVSQAEPGQAYVPTGLDPGIPAGLKSERDPRFRRRAPSSQPTQYGEIIPQPLQGRQQEIQAGKILDYTKQKRPTGGAQLETGGKVAEPSSYPASGEPGLGRDVVRESYEMPEYRKRAIQKSINEVADRIASKQEKESKIPRPPKPPEQSEMKFGSPRKGGEGDPGKRDYFLGKTGKARDPRMSLSPRANPLDQRRLSERPAFWDKQWKAINQEVTRQILDIQKQLSSELPLETSQIRGTLNGLERNLDQFLRDAGLHFEGDKPVWETVRGDRIAAAENFYEAIQAVRSLKGRLPPPEAISSPRRDPANSVGEVISNVLTDFGSIYDKWMVDRLDEYGGPLTRAFVRTARGIMDRQKELYGQLTTILDRARRLAGGVESWDRRASGPGVTGWVRDLPRRTVESARAMRAASWMHRIAEVTRYTGVANSVRAIEGAIPIPRWAQALVDMGRSANLEIGRMFQPVSPGFVASGLWQRMLTGLGYDIIRQGGGVMWDRWIDGLVYANRMHGATRMDLENRMREMKRTLDDPMVTAEMIEHVAQDMHRHYPEAVTHIRHLGRWHEVIHSNLFNYLEQTAQRATHVRAFREQFPMTPDGRTAWRELVTQMRRELVPETNRDLDGLIRALNGHPTDEYGGGMWNDLFRTNPGQPGNLVMRMANDTVNSLAAKLALTAQTVTQVPELVVGATPQKLGYTNYVKAMVRVRQLYNEMERIGAVNRVIHDYTLSRHSPLRSTSRAIGNVISKVTAQAMFNELQEALAAATARVVTENILSGRLSYWERHILPQTFREMGFSEREINAMMRGDQTMLNQFQRKASAWLTGGNKALAESSRPGGHRLFNSIFRFQTYPMMKMNQFRNTATQFVDAWATGRNRGAATTSLATFIFGTIAQGAGLSMLSSLAFGGKAGFNVNKEEAKDQYWKFLGESFAGGMGGPLYILWRGARMGGWRGVGEQAMRTMFPYAVANEIGDFVDGARSYSDKDLNQKLATFASNRIPATKMLATGAAMFGISNNNHELDAAIKGLYRWQRSEMGYDVTIMNRLEDERKEFRTQVKKAMEAMKDGDTEAYTEAWLKAADLASNETFRRSVQRRKLLVDLNRKPLSEEMKDKLKKRIGMKAYERLEDWDALVEAVAAGAMPAGKD